MSEEDTVGCSGRLRPTVLRDVRGAPDFEVIAKVCVELQTIPAELNFILLCHVRCTEVHDELSVAVVCST